MTVTTQRNASPQPGTLPILFDQLAAIEVWNRTRRDRQQALMNVGLSREARLDASRQLEALDRVHETLVARLDRALAAEVSPMQIRTSPTAILAHRHEWFVQKVADALAGMGVHVTAVVDNGAEAVGALVADQPDLLLVEEALPMLNGRKVVADAAFFSPSTHIVVQVADGDVIGNFLDAGARAAVTRQVPPGDVAQAMWALLTPTGEEPASQSATR